MLKQNTVTNTTVNEMLVELSESEQEASNGGLSMAPATTPSEESPFTMPAFPSMPVGLYGPPNVSCPACSSGMNPNYHNGPAPTSLQINA